MMLPVLFEVKEEIGVITLNRPEKRNAFNREMARLVQEKLDHCAADPQVRCVLLTGAGKAFSAGQDLSEVMGPEAVEFEAILSTYYNPIITRIRELPKPVVAAVNGVAAGAGANIALCADLVIAGAAASFIQAFSRIGLIPDSGGTFILPRLVGWQKAAALMLLGEPVSATEAERIGMICKVFPDDGFAEAAFALAKSLAALPTRALALTKQALNAAWSNNLEQQLQLEDRLQQAAAQTADFREGLSAFAEKRAPRFTGR